MKTRLMSMLMMLTAMTAGAQENVKMRFNFEDVSGADVKDAVSGITAKAVGAAKVVEMGKFHILDLGNASGFLNMTAQAGKVFAAQEDHSISVYYRVDEEASLSGNGYFLWAFSTAAACGATSGVYSAYRLNAQRIASSTGGYQNETGYSVGTPSAKGRWMHVCYTQQGTTGRLYIDGTLKGTISNMPKNSTLYPTTKPSVCWIGRAPFSGDSYLKRTLVADFCLYGEALTATQVAGLAAKTEELEHEYKYGTPGDFSQLGTVLDECKAFLDTADEGYAANALAELQDVVTIAEAEFAAGRISQTMIDSRVSQLLAALEQAKGTLGFTLSAATTFTPGTQGFRHPGGLHTEADFERIRQAIANGDTRIKQAWQKLCANEYAQASIATWPVETIVRGGSGQNYMNVARGAAMAYQNALRWKIGGTKANADGAVRILMAWARGNKYVSGDTNLSLAAGIYGYELAQAAELMRDYEGWSAADFDEFKRYMMKTWYPVACDFLRRRHDTWLNSANSGKGQRPGHYWSNWGLCNALCLMSIGILCDDVHIYNQGVSFYKYDHVGTFKDRSAQSVIVNDGCNEFIGNLVPVVLPDERGPLGYLGQMQESGRDQGHALMALGLAIDICQVAYNQGDDLFGYMDDRIAAGAEHVAALNFGGVAGSSLPWITYNYADCRGTMGAGWEQTAPNEGGIGGHRPYWDRLLGYYEGVRGVKMQYAEKASAAVGIDMGGGNYGQTSGGFDHLGFSTLTSYRPPIDAEQAPVVLSGDIIYNGVTYKNQTNLGGLKYNYEAGKTKAVPADGADITLLPQLPDSITDNGQWLWNTGETTRQITVKADHSYLYRVQYTADNGTVSEQSFAIAVAGDAQPDVTTPEITIDGVISQQTEATVLYGNSLILYLGNSTGWTNDYKWDNGQTGTSVITVPAITTDRTYTCQYVNQGGYVNEQQFHITVKKAQQYINGTETDEATLLPNSHVTLQLVIPAVADPSEVTWHDGTTGTTFAIDKLQAALQATATYDGQEYPFALSLLGGGQLPTDATSLLVNPDFATLDDTGWTMTGTWGNQRFNGAVEVWHSTGFDFSQTVSGLPAGNFTVTCQLANGEGSNTGYLYATTTLDGKAVETKATVKQSCVGSDFDTQRNKMAANAAYARLSVSTDVNDGTLTVGIKEPSSGNTWLVWDNFTLTYNGCDETGIQDLTVHPSSTSEETAPSIIHDLQGRRLHPHTSKKGVYIKNGKKHIR